MGGWSWWAFGGGGVGWGGGEMGVLRVWSCEGGGCVVGGAGVGCAGGVRGCGFG